MLRITTTREGDRPTLRVEGKFSGAWVAEAEQSWRNLLRDVGAGKSVIVDLNGVTSVDAQGKALLRSMKDSGAQFEAEGPLIRHLLEQMTDARGK